jgi:hypothetical protein
MISTEKSFPCPACFRDFNGRYDFDPFNYLTFNFISTIIQPTFQKGVGINEDHEAKESGQGYVQVQKGMLKHFLLG